MQMYRPISHSLLVMLVMTLSAFPTVGDAQDVSSSQGITVFRTYEDLASYMAAREDTLLVVNFWATWCKPCVRELPFFQELDSHFEGRKAKVLLVSLDLPKDVDTKLLAFAEDWDITRSVVALTDTDHNEWIPKVHENWTGAIPATWVVRRGRSVFHEGEFDDWKALMDFVNSMAP